MSVRLQSSIMSLSALLMLDISSFAATNPWLQEEYTSTNIVRVKVKLAKPVGYKVKVKLAKPVCSKVKDVDPVDEAGHEESPVAYKTKMTAESHDVPVIKSVAFAKSCVYQVPYILAPAMASATDAQVSDIATETYANPIMETVKYVQPVKPANTQTEWYEKFQAVGGSKLWWILRVAKAMAERGEDVSEIKNAFDETINKWYLED